MKSSFRSLPRGRDSGQSPWTPGRLNKKAHTVLWAQSTQSCPLSASHTQLLSPTRASLHAIASQSWWEAPSLARAGWPIPLSHGVWTCLAPEPRSQAPWLVKSSLVGQSFRKHHGDSCRSRLQRETPCDWVCTNLPRRITGLPGLRSPLRELARRHPQGRPPVGKCLEGSREGWWVWVGEAVASYKLEVPQTAHPSQVLTSHADLQTAAPEWACPGRGPWGRAHTGSARALQCPGLCADLRRGPPPGCRGAGQLPLCPPSLLRSKIQTNASASGWWLRGHGAVTHTPRPPGQLFVPPSPSLKTLHPPRGVTSRASEVFLLILNALEWFQAHRKSYIPYRSLVFFSLGLEYFVI